MEPSIVMSVASCHTDWPRGNSWAVNASITRFDVVESSVSHHICISATGF